jgi:ubiquinone/menaquinone biosynthesis C-methylase UbiE
MPDARIATTASSQDILRQQYATESGLASRIDLHRRFSTHPEQWHRWLFDQIIFRPGDTVLELGCGEGIFWRENAERIPQNVTFALSDFSPGMVDAAKKHLASVLPHASFEVMDAASIPKPDHSMDTVMAHHMLYHVSNIDQALREIRRVLKEGGTLYAATNGTHHVQEIDNLAIQQGIPVDRMHEWQPGNFWLETGEEILRRWFTHVTCVTRDDALRVTEAEPLIAYTLSLAACRALTAEQKNAIAEQIRHIIAEQGVFHVTKASGIFIATSPYVMRSL